MELVRSLRNIIFLLALIMGLINIGVIAYQAYKMYIVNNNRGVHNFNTILQPVRVFQIGFSKCGTKSLQEFFTKNGVPSIHHDGGFLALSMYDNYQKGLPLLGPQYTGYLAFFDMERLYDMPMISIPQMLFRELDQQYPGSKFILNTRDKQKWLISKARHPAYHHNMRWIDLHAQFLNKSKDEVLELWSQEWDVHYNAVLEYFKDRPEDLLVFDIETDSPKKLCEFFKDYFKLLPKYYLHVNKSDLRDRTKKIDY